MRSRGERVSITSWCMPDNGRVSGGSLTVRLKQHVHPPVSHPDIHRMRTAVIETHSWCTHDGALKSMIIANSARIFTSALLATRNSRENMYRSIASTMTMQKPSSYWRLVIPEQLQFIISILFTPSHYVLKDQAYSKVSRWPSSFFFK